MKSAPINKKEVWLLLGPIVVIAVAGIVWTSRERQRNERASGPLRTVIDNVQVLPVSPLAAWRGYTHRITLSGRVDGATMLAEGLKLSNVWSLSDVVMVTNAEGKTSSPKVSQVSKEHSVPEQCRTDICRIDTQGSTHNESDWTRTFLVKAPATKSNWHFKGKISSKQDLQFKNSARASSSAYRQALNNGNRSDFKAIAQAAHFEVALPPVELAKGQIPQVRGSKIIDGSPLQKQQTIFKEYDQHEAIRFYLATASLLSASHPSTGQNLYQVRWFDCGIYNLKGQRIASNWEGIYPVAYEDNLVFDDKLHVDLQLPKLNFQAQNQLILRGFVSVNESYPAAINIPLYPKWYLRPSRTLRLQSVRASKETVTIRLLYSGQAPLSPRNTKWENVSQSYHDQRFSPMMWEGIEKPVGHLLFITNWSEHLERPNGMQIWDRAWRVSKGNEKMGATGVKFLPNKVIEVTYKVQTSKLLRPGEAATFKAQIGVENDGFVPVAVKISRPK